MLYFVLIVVIKDTNSDEFAVIEIKHFVKKISIFF